MALAGIGSTRIVEKGKLHDHGDMDRVDKIETVGVPLQRHRAANCPRDNLSHGCNSRSILSCGK
jgi:hypothetical protein